MEDVPRRARPKLVTTWTLAALWAAFSVCLAVPAARGPLLARLNAALDEAQGLFASGQLDAARDRYRQIGVDAQALGEESLPLARALDGQGDVARESGHPEEAVPLYRRSAELWERLLGADQPRLAITLHNLGACYLALGRREAAEPELERALRIFETRLGRDSPAAAATRAALGR